MLRMVGWRPASVNGDPDPLGVERQLARTLQHQRCRLGVVRREGVVGEEVPVARVDEQLGELGSDDLDQLAGGVEVAPLPEERVLVHAVDLDRNALRPRAEGPLSGDREAALIEERSPRTRSGLGESLRFADPEGEAGVDQAPDAERDPTS